MTPTDAFRIQRIDRGDRAALDKAHARPVYRVRASPSNDPHEAANTLHEVFLDVWRVAGSFEGRRQARTWVFGIADCKVSDARRRRGRVDLTDEVPETGETEASAETGYAAVQGFSGAKACSKT